MDSNSTEFEVPRAVQKAAALGGLVIDAYLAAHESRQARIAPQSGSKRPPFTEVLKQAGSSIPGLQDALVALAGEENAADLKKLVELVGDNPDLAELVRKATMNARGVVASDRSPAPSAARPAGGGEDRSAALGAALARGDEADSRTRLLAMLRASVEERLALMDARLNGRVSALQQRVVHLEASIDGLAQDIERLKQRARERRDAASRTAAVREPEPTVPAPPGDAARPHVDPAPQSGEAATVEPTPSTPETGMASPRVDSPGKADVVGPPRRRKSVRRQRRPLLSVKPAIPANGPAAAEGGADEDQLLMALLDARESDHDARITEGEHAVGILEKHVVTLTAQVRELTELHNDA
jgi:hypothetical protein